MKFFLFFFIIASLSLASVVEAKEKVLLLNIKGSINPGSSTFILDGISHANQNNFEAIIIQLNTPGGLLTSTRDIIQGISQSNIPVILYIAPGGASATSAGALIALSSHLAVMSHGTNIGAAHPVGSGGEEVKGVMGEKITNDTAALARAQAELRGRKSDIAEQIVTKSKSFSAEEALKYNLINFIADNINDLLKKSHNTKVLIKNTEKILNTSNTEIIPFHMNTKQEFLHFIADPNISALLMAVGGVALYIEISSGFSVMAPGLIGIFCLILGLTSLQTLPINIGGAALFGFGFILLIAEAFIISYGTLTIGAMICIFLGGLFLIDPSSSTMQISLSILIPTLAGIGFVAGIVAFLIAKESKANTKQSKDQNIGMLAIIVSVSENKKSGTAMVNGEIWNFVSSSELSAGEHKKVLAINNMSLQLGD